jgi:hypothetical protein
MRTADYELRADERTRFEKELFMPLVVIVCVAALVLYATSSAVPGQFVGRGFHMPLGGAVSAAVVLLIIWTLRFQRPQKYAITDDGLEIELPVITYKINFADIAEVVSVADRRAQPLIAAIVIGSPKRAYFGVRNILKRITGGQSAIALPAGDYNFTTSDTGGARIHCKNGSRVLVSPMELSAFLRHLEAEFQARGLEARIIREVPVQIGRS